MPSEAPENHLKPGQTAAAAIQLLLQEHYSLVVAIALARVRNRDAAEDLAQEVFLRAFIRLDLTKDAEGRLAWLICVTRNLATDWLRRRQSSSRLIKEVSQLAPTRNGQTPTAHNPRERLMQREENSALEEALAKLPVEQREIVLLHYMDGQTRRDIAAKLRVHPATVGRHLDAALAQLKGTLEPVLRQHLAGGKPSAPALARASALLGAMAASSESTRAKMLGGAAWRQGEVIVSEAVRGLGSSTSQALAGKGTGAAFINAAAKTGIGAMTMAKGKAMSAIVLVALAAGSAAIVTMKNDGGNAANARNASAAPAAQGAGVPNSNANGALPALPAGWKFKATPSNPSVRSSSASEGDGEIKAEGLGLQGALGYWAAQSRDVNPALKQKTERYDVTLMAPSRNVDTKEMFRVMQVEMQRLFRFQAAIEKRTVACLVLKCPGGRLSLATSARSSPIVRAKTNVYSMRDCSMQDLVRSMALNVEMPVFDETGIAGKFDVDLIASPQKTAWSDEALARLGLQVMREKRLVEVLVAKPNK